MTFKLQNVFRDLCVHHVHQIIIVILYYYYDSLLLAQLSGI